MKIFSIKNEKLGFFNRPIYCESEAEALSYIQNVLMSDADRALLNLKDDLALYYLGDIDFTNGSIIPMCMADVSGGLVGDVVCVCSLREIFDTIPEDKLKPALTLEDIEKCYKMLKDVERVTGERFDDVYDKLHKLDKCKKGVKLYS